MRNRRHLPGAGNTAKFKDLEEQPIEWVHDQNEKGLVVKDKYITSKAREIRRSILNQGPPHSVDLLKFKTSSGLYYF